MAEMMRNPMIQRMMQDMMQDPNMINQVIHFSFQPPPTMSVIFRYVTQCYVMSFMLCHLLL